MNFSLIVFIGACLEKEEVFYRERFKNHFRFCLVITENGSHRLTFATVEDEIAINWSGRTYPRLYYSLFKEWVETYEKNPNWKPGRLGFNAWMFNYQSVS